MIIDSAGANLYGTTENGGQNSEGAVYKVVISSGMDKHVLHNFAGGTGDGSLPYAGVIFDSSASNLFGTTELGGSSTNTGTVYKLSTSGVTFTKIYGFPATGGTNPRGGLVSDSSNNLYGTTYLGGSGFGNGVVFKLTWNGTAYTCSVLHTFAGGSSDGANPYAGLAIDPSSGELYGTTVMGGASGYGTVFKLGSDGSGYSVLYSFAGGTNDGANPYATVTLDSSGNLWGTTVNGGMSSEGTVFEITP